MSNEEIARKAAAQFRQEHDLGSAPILSVTQLLERVMNVGVAFVAGAAPGHGMVVDWENKRLVAVGCTDQPMQLRSTLAHELGHLWLGHLDRHMSTSQEWSTGTPREDQADAFARHFLMPAEAVADVTQGKEPTLAVLSDLVHSYLVSPATLPFSFVRVVLSTRVHVKNGVLFPHLHLPRNLDGCPNTSSSLRWQNNHALLRNFLLGRLKAIDGVPLARPL